jgi:hypothetical protein
MKTLLPLLPLLALLTACNPSAKEVETALVDRGFGARESACVARELDGQLDARDWRVIAEVAGDTMRTQEEWRDMTIGEIGDKLQRVGDSRLIATLLRAGLGCALIGGERVERASRF